MARKKKVTATARRATTVARRPHPIRHQKPKGPGWSIISLNALEKWRKDNNLTKSAACKLWDVSLGYYQMWVKGDYTPSLDMQQRIQKILKTKVAKHHTISKNDIAKVAKKKKENLAKSGQKSSSISQDDPDILEIVAALKATMGIVQSRIEHGGAISDDDLINLTGRIQQALLGDFDF